MHKICTTALFYMLAPTCFGSSLPSSGSFWIRLSYVKIQIDMVYHIMYKCKMYSQHNVSVLLTVITSTELKISFI
jgi:hypothetical protein